MSETALDTELADATQSLLSVLADLTDEQFVVPYLETVNPILWELGHVGWFQERFALRDLLGRDPMHVNGDELWNSSEVVHATRWYLPLPSRTMSTQFVAAVTAEVREAVADDPTNTELAYHALYSIMHHDAHVEALMYTRQHLGYPAPTAWKQRPVSAAAAATGPGRQIQVPAGVHMLGGSPDQPFVMDNEKWETPVEVAEFWMDELPVTQAQFAEFVADGGYEREDLWNLDGWAWKLKQEQPQPVYWRRAGSGWERRVFDQWRALEPDHPMIHVNWFEAKAYCAWANRRLPTEAEWERAACYDPSGEKRYSRPWGTDETSAEYAVWNIDQLGTAPVDSCEAGASALGFRHLLGNVWEWTDSVFEPLPGFVRDSYLDNSEPWFGSRKVLRGGSWATRPRYVRNTFRNYFTPDRVDIFGGFRTCATDS